MEAKEAKKPRYHPNRVRLLAELKNLQMIYGNKVPSTEITRMCRLQKMSYARVTRVLHQLKAKSITDNDRTLRVGEKKFWMFPLED